MFRRLQDKSQSGPLLNGGNLLIVYVVERLMRWDQEFFSLVTTEHEQWARETEEKLITELPLESCLLTELDVGLIRIEWDERNLFRCLAVHGISHLRETHRDVRGSGLLLMEETAECFLADKMKSCVAELLEKERGTMEQVLPGADIEGTGEERGEIIDIIALAYLCKTPIHLYRGNHGNKPICQVSYPAFCTMSPVLLYYTTEDNHTWFCDLLYKNSDNKDLWVIHKDKKPFENVWEEMTDQEAEVTFKDVLLHNQKLLSIDLKHDPIF